MEDVLGAGGRPAGEQAVVGIGERAASTDSDESGVTDVRQDHESLVRPRGGAVG